MTEFRKGDIVTLRGRVEYVFSGEDGDSNVTVKVDGHYGQLYISPGQVTLVHHVFEIGDRVRSVRGADGRRLHGGPGQVRAVSGDFAWIEDDKVGAHYTIALCDLEYAPNDTAGENTDASGGDF
jgi:hypothetical protein